MSPNPSTRENVFRNDLLYMGDHPCGAGLATSHISYCYSFLSFKNKPPSPASDGPDEHVCIMSAFVVQLMIPPFNVADDTAISLSGALMTYKMTSTWILKATGLVACKQTFPERKTQSPSTGSMVHPSAKFPPYAQPSFHWVIRKLK